MCDFVNVLNLLLDRVSISPFIFNFPRNGFLFAPSDYPPTILKKLPQNNLALYKNLDTTLSQIIKGKPPKNYEYLKTKNSRNKKMTFVADANSESVCLVKNTTDILLFNWVRFRQFYSEELNNMVAEDALIYVGIKDDKLQTSYDLDLDYFVITTNENLYLTSDRKYEKDAFLFDTAAAFKNYHTSGDSFKWIEILFFFENRLREIFQRVKLNTEYTKNISNLKYIVDGERNYFPLEGYIEYIGDTTYEKVETDNDYTLITGFSKLPIVNIINYDYFFIVEYIFQSTTNTDKNIAKYCTEKDYRLNYQFNIDDHEKCFLHNNFPYLKNNQVKCE